MVIVNDTGTNLASILTREAAAPYFALQLMRKGTNTVEVVWPTVTTDEYNYRTLSFIYDFVPGTNYYGHLYATTQNGSGSQSINFALVESEVWRGKFFCTPQTDLQIFSIYDGVFEAPERDNTYIYA
jgi:hypothetical protein